MRCHLLTKNLFCSLLCFGLLSLNGVAFAQVYKSYDADGNVVFSDKPTQDSREVEVTKPNVSDSFEIPPPPPPVESTLETKPEAEPEPEPEPVTQPIADDDSADTNNDGRVSRREKEDQRKERRKKNREEAEAAEEY
jgi:hypothetical protein